MSYPQCHTPYDFAAVGWAQEAPGRTAAASFLGAFGTCSLACQDRCRNTAAADPDATVLVAFALISTAIALQGDRAIATLLEGASTVPTLAQTVFVTVMREDFTVAREPVRQRLEQASVGERSEMVEWWSNTAAMPPGQLSAMMRQFKLS